MDDKLKKIMFIVLGCGVLLILFLFIISSCESKISPQQLETTIMENAKDYYSSYEEVLPGEESVISLSLGDLVNKGIIKELDKLLDDTTTCSGSLTIENNNNYYIFSPSLDCTMGSEKYKTENLKTKLLESVVSSGNGLYNINNSYYFRGDTVDNYIIFDGLLWRITKINEDGTIRLIEADKRKSTVWDNRYNTLKSSNTGINDYVHNNINSRIKDELEDIYNSETVLTDNAKGYIKKTSLCVGKRSQSETINDGSIECSSTIDNQYLGLIQLNEYLIASLDANCLTSISRECRNYNYLADLDGSYWSLTGNSENNNQVYKIDKRATLLNASSSGIARIVINISDITNVTGTGTEEDPYVVSGFSNQLREIED